MDAAAPHNTEAERAVLGALLAKPDGWPLASALLTHADFYRRAHELIFRAMGVCISRNRPIDLVILHEILDERGLLDEVGGPPTSRRWPMACRGP